ncbi:LuxR C-terminal-related transcriptional regulator [Rhizobium sp. 2MFCol3.1]|uniref:helix-turn-helix transcriptional regulator n=1 Tax=Rhizobium sp. 2MFCol3.1 TaxID=1246459 RepID=UPI000370E8DC|nr:LuxR C-terminal-related transcriptional regulator [Rhizobium sp. 2MFCol3.1]
MKLVFDRGASGTSKHSSDVGEPFRYLIREFGLQHFLFAHFPSADRTGLAENVIASNWPADILLRVERSGEFYRGRFLAELRRSILPAFAESTGLGRMEKEGDDNELLDSCYGEGFANTMGFPIHDAQHRHYLIMLSGQHRISDEARLGSLVLSVMKVVNVYAPLERPESTPLSGRELDCLKWAAAGKSSEEIALILGLSSHTVNDYLKTAMRKMNAVTRIQAVAIACRLRLL